MKKRFKDNKASYLCEGTVIVCPNCGKAAISDFSNRANNGGKVLHCEHCGLAKRLEDFEGYGGYVKLNCPGCGSLIDKTFDLHKNPPKQLIVTCDVCRHKLSVKPKLERYDAMCTNIKEDGLMHDHLTGQPLYYQERVRGNLFWAYNRSHIALMQDYLSSDLRERVGMSVVAKLPTFIKIKKNKELILKVLDKWLKN